MLRLLRIFLLVAALAAVAASLADNPGALALEWRGWRVETSLIVLLSCAALLFAALHFGLLIYSWLRHPELRRMRRGLGALTRGMTAIAAGNTTTARNHAARAVKLLGPGPLGLLLQAQAAQLAGEDMAASGHYTALTALPEGEFLGLRGLLGQAMRRGDVNEAKRLLARAGRLQPKSPWLQQVRDEIDRAAAPPLDAAPEPPQIVIFDPPARPDDPGPLAPD